MEINIGMSECHKNVDNYYSSNIMVWIPCCAGREAFDGVEPLPESEIVTRRQPKKLNGLQISWLWLEQVSVHLERFLIFELLVSMLTVMNFCGSD